MALSRPTTPAIGKFDCPVCFNEFELATVEETPCEHQICIDCYAKLPNVKKCPSCRQSISSIKEPSRFFREELIEYKRKQLFVPPMMPQRAPAFNEEALNTAPAPSDGSRFQIVVRDLQHKKRCFMVKSSDTVLSLKEQLHERLGLPVGEQRLLCLGRQLDDSHRLSDYRIEQRSELHLVARVHGGM